MMERNYGSTISQARNSVIVKKPAEECNSQLSSFRASIISYPNRSSFESGGGSGAASSGAVVPSTCSSSLPAAWYGGDHNQVQSSHGPSQQQQQPFRLNTVIRRDSSSGETTTEVETTGGGGLTPPSPFFYRPPAAFSNPMAAACRGFSTQRPDFGYNYNAAAAAQSHQQQPMTNNAYLHYNGGNYANSDQLSNQRSQHQQQQHSPILQQHSPVFLPPSYHNSMFTCPPFVPPFIAAAAAGMGRSNGSASLSDSLGGTGVGRGDVGGDGGVGGGGGFHDGVKVKAASLLSTAAVSEREDGTAIERPKLSELRRLQQQQKQGLVGPLPTALLAAMQQEGELPELELGFGVFEVKVEPEEETAAARNPSSPLPGRPFAAERHVSPRSPPPSEELVGIRAVSRLLAATGYGSLIKAELEGGQQQLKQELSSPSATPATYSTVLNSAPRRRRRRHSELEEAGDKRPISNCHVCGDKAIAHMHYGGICCYSCKAFFRRAVQSGKDRKYICKGENRCPVSVTNRRGCQKCRFEKCKDIGMVASWVLSDEQCEMRFGKSKLARKHGYGNKNTTNSTTTTTTTSTTTSTTDDDDDKKTAPANTMPVELKKEVVSTDSDGGGGGGNRSHLFSDADELTVEYMSCVYEASKEMISFSEENTFLWTRLFGSQATERHNYSSVDMSSLIQTVIKKNIFMLEANQYFKKLDFRDKKELLSKNMTEMCQLRGALRFDPKDNKFQWYFNQKEKMKAAAFNSQNKAIGEDDLNKFYKSELMARGVMAIMERIVRVGLSENAILILMHVVIFSPDGLQLNQRHFVEEVQVEYLNLLLRYFLHGMSEEQARAIFCKVIALLVDLRELCDESKNSEIST